MVALTRCVCFLFFLKRAADVMALVMLVSYVMAADVKGLSVVFGGLFVWVISRLAGDRPVSPQFRKVHRPPLLPISDRFP